MTTKIATWVFRVLLGATSVSACVGGGDDTDSNTNWVRLCQSSSDCENGMDCVCGLCTRSCQRSSDCTSLDDKAVCAPVTNAIATCTAGSTPEAGVCTAPCNAKTSCPNGARCLGGACMPEAPMPTGSTDSCSANFPPDGCQLWPANAYGDPFANPSPDGTTCPYSLWEDGCIEYGTCDIGCSRDSDCPVVADGTAVARCIDQSCKLVCDPATICPSGMVCFTFPETPGRSSCEWAMDWECPVCPRSPSCSNW